MSLPWLKLEELDTKRVLNVTMRVSSISLLIFCSYERGDDIEVVATIKDCKEISVLLRRALEAATGALQRSSKSFDGAMVHQFKNLDGGADAAFKIARKQETIEIFVERSDEGNFEFAISKQDAGRLLDFLDNGLEVASTLTQ